MPESIGTIPIACLPAPSPGMAVAFRIPAYQRGYRWKSEDVTRLLDDLQEFLDEGVSGRPFYCLQPLVVRKAGDEDAKPKHWEVVDGQQRLTTLFLLWKFLNNQPPYELSYATRDCSREFLNAPTAGEDGKLPNIDFHHIYHAHLAIQEWFNGDDHEKDPFKKLLSDTDRNGRNVRLIWYEIGDDDDAVAAFTRLNVGKIPLTDEELVRALFLRNQKGGTLSDSAFQHRLALEWDRIETSLQAPDFWGFVSKQTGPEGGRIRLLFDLCVPEGTSTADRGIFQHFEEELKGASPEKLRAEWQQIVSRFEQLEEWHRDPELFHLVGFLTTILGKNSVSTLRQLIDEADAKTKSTFADGLRRTIRIQLVGKDRKLEDFISDLNYSDPQKTLQIRQALALFNIATLLRTERIQSRFPFHLYHGQHWDIEHVQSQAGDGLGDVKRQLAWLEACKPELVYEAKLLDRMNDNSGKQSPNKLLAEIEEFREADAKPDFSDLEKRVRACLGESDSNGDLHSIGNLTLLDFSTNREYGNSPFAVKRAKILEADRAGTFILPCTRDLFLKVFSKDPGNLRRWVIEKDGAAHETAIGAALKTFFSGKGGAES
jgi:hypothetical protein